MDTLQEDFEGCVMDYDLLVEKNIFIENILNKEQLLTLDRYILHCVDKQYRKVAFVVGKVLEQLQTNHQLYFFQEYKQYSDLLITQRIAYLQSIFRLTINGDIKAMRFSEVALLIQDLILLDDKLYLLRVEDSQDNTLSFNMADIIASGLKEQLKLIGETVDENYLKQQALALVQSQKEEDSYQTTHNGIAYHVKEGVYQLKQQVGYGNEPLEHIYDYLNDIVENHQQQLPNIVSLCKAFPIKHSIDLPVNVIIDNKNYTLHKVPQQHKTGCSIACVSTVTGVNYLEVLNTAKQLFSWPKNRSRLGLTSEKIQSLLSHYKVKHKDYLPTTSWQQCSDLSICMIDVDITGKYCHVVVFFRHDGKDYIIDPALENPIRIDFYNIRLAGCLNIC